MNGGIWAVARHTFAQCVRMKIAAVFIIMLAVALGAMPFLMKGDGTLAGRIRTFLVYSTAATAVLLGLVTVFVSVGVVAFDVRDKQIFSVATKPLARWQYVVGRWAGVVLLDVVLAAAATVAIYGLAQYLRGQQPLNITDYRTVETEIFAARRRVSPEPLDVEEAVKARIKKMKKEGQYAHAVEGYKAKTGGDEAEAESMLADELRSQELKDRQSAAPMRTLMDARSPACRIHWRFGGIKVAGKAAKGRGRVTRVIRRPALAYIEADGSILGKLIPRGPVGIGNTIGSVGAIAEDHFVVLFHPRDAERPGVLALAAGSQVHITIEPTVQITYKATPAERPADGKLHSTWVALNPSTRYAHEVAREDPVNMSATVTVPGRTVADDGKMEVVYLNNQPGTTVTIPHEDVAVLYRVGGFEWNFLRAGMLVILQLMFLAGVGVLAGSFLSFPVGCVACIPVVAFGLVRSFLAEAVKLPTRGGVEVGTSVYIGHYIFKVMRVLLPDLQGMFPGGWLVDGGYISWAFLGETAVLTLAVRTLLMLLLACCLFHKRELARVQV